MDEILTESLLKPSMHEESKIPLIYRNFIKSYIKHNLVLNKTQINNKNFELITEQNFNLEDCILKNHRFDKEFSILTDLYTGKLINKLKSKIPCFVHTYGVLPDENKIIQEKISGIYLYEYLQSSEYNISTFFYILTVLVLSLAKAQEKIGFVHNALYSSNIKLVKTNLKEINISLGTITYKVKVQNNLLPIIIDYSSSRVSDKGFGISYYQNPTLFTPGRDLYTLICSCLAHLSYFKDFDKVRWINNYFHNFFDIKEDNSFAYWFDYFKQFKITDDNPVSNLHPKDFLNWLRNEHGEIFEKFLFLTTREIKPLTKNCENLFSNFDFNSLKNDITKRYCSLVSKQDYSSTKDDEKQTLETVKFYERNTPQEPIEIINLNYNFPLSNQYIKDDIVKIIEVYKDTETKRNIMSNFIVFIRMMKTLNIKLPDKDLLSRVFANKDNLTYNLMIIKNLPLYKFYNFCKHYEKQDITGDYIVILNELTILANTLSSFFPFLSRLKMYLIFQRLSSDIYINGKILYNSPSTLQQINALWRQDKNRLFDLVFKCIQKNEKSLEIVETFLDNDIQKLVKLREFVIETSDYSTNRIKSRQRDISNILNQLKIINQKDDKTTKIEKYLDFGGNDGSISYAISELLPDLKEAYSADLEKWFSRKINKFKNVNYIALKPNQIIPLQDNSIDLVTCFQVLHHIEDVHFVLAELSRICKGYLIIREHNCENDDDRMFCDLEHSMFEITFEKQINLRFINDYIAWYKSKEEWNKLLLQFGFSFIQTIKYPYKKTPTNYYYACYKKL